MVVKTPKSHERCLLCGSKNRAGLNLKFRCEDGTVSAEVLTNLLHQGYAGILHGGVITSLLDCAMCNALFNHGVEGVTVDMNVSFKKEVPCDSTLTLVGKVLDGRGPIYKTEARIMLSGVDYAVARARFVKRRVVATVE